jgi:hypothetical protein
MAAGSDGLSLSHPREMKCPRARRIAGLSTGGKRRPEVIGTGAVIRTRQGATLRAVANRPCVLNGPARQPRSRKSFFVVARLVAEFQPICRKSQPRGFIHRLWRPEGHSHASSRLFSKRIVHVAFNPK